MAECRRPCSTVGELDDSFRSLTPNYGPEIAKESQSRGVVRHLQGDSVILGDGRHETETQPVSWCLSAFVETVEALKIFSRAQLGTPGPSSEITA
jgi:hypothetical protein